MMKKLIVFAFATLLASFAQAQTAPDVLVKQVTEEVLEIVRKDRDIQNGNAKKAIELVDAKVIPHFNFQHMTALAVGKDWRKASPQGLRQNATAQPILNIQVFHTGIAFETGPLRPGESKSFKFEPKNEGGYSLVIHLLKDKTVYQRCLEAYNEFERSFGQTG